MKELQEKNRRKRRKHKHQIEWVMELMEGGWEEERNHG